MTGAGLRTAKYPDTATIAKSPSTTVDTQPRSGASLRPISRAASAAAISASDIQSRLLRSESRPLSRGRQARPRISVTTPGPTLMRNSHCQEKFSVNQPPVMGPSAGASTASTPPMVVARVCWKPRSNSRKIAENTSGMSTPPAKPCNIRHTISDPNPPLKAQPIDANVKTAIAPTNSHRMEKTRLSRPVRGMAMTSAIR